VYFATLSFDLLACKRVSLEDAVVVPNASVHTSHAPYTHYSSSAEKSLQTLLRQIGKANLI